MAQLVELFVPGPFHAVPTYKLIHNYYAHDHGITFKLGWKIIKNVLAQGNKNVSFV